MLITAKLVVALALATLEAHDVEDDGQQNYLFDVVVDGADYKVSYSSYKSLGNLKEGDKVDISTKADCTMGWGIDERFTTFWASYRVYTCDASELEVLK